MRTIIVAFLSFFLIACATTSSSTRATASWQGKKLADVSAELGSPVVTTVAPNGNTYYTYIARSYKTYPVPVNQRAATLVVGPHGQTIGVNNPDVNMAPTSILVGCYITVEVNAQKTIVGQRMQGPNC